MPFLDEDTKFDLVVSSVILMANEAGYYLAHKSNATLVLYASVQASVINLNAAMGQPNNPALIPINSATYS